MPSKSSLAECAMRVASRRASTLSAQLDRITNSGQRNREGPGEVVEAGIGEGTSLEEGSHRDSAGPSLCLQTSYVRALVGLDVRSKRDPQALAPGRHAIQIRLEPVEVEKQCRSRQVGEPRGHP